VAGYIEFGRKLGKMNWHLRKTVKTKNNNMLQFQPMLSVKPVLSAVKNSTCKLSLATTHEDYSRSDIEDQILYQKYCIFFSFGATAHILGLGLPP
jgi:hypothetical protein